VLRATATTALVLALVAAGCHDSGDGDEARKGPPAQSFRSRPDLRPPPLRVTTPARGTAPGLLFLAPKRNVAQAGPLIVDDSGEVVWFHPLDTKGVADFKVQRYDGRPVLTWWRGRADKGVGDGWYVIADESYRQVATVTAGNGLAGDIHEFLITPRDTALISIYRRLPRDLSALGGPEDGEIFDGTVQELDIRTGRVLFEWHSIDHVDLRESYAKVPAAAQGDAAAPFDYFHLNSIAEDADGDLILSARHTHAVYKVARADGRVVWRLGGKQSDFALGPGARFALQHDARRLPDGTLSLFDNGAQRQGSHSRALVLRLDERGRRATVVRSVEHPDGLLSETQGNVQLLPGGHLLVGWGSNPVVSEVNSDGRVLLDLRFGGEGADSYRAFRFDWRGRPAEPPALTLADGVAYASWNGATEVARWQLLAGPTPNELVPLTSRARTGFETAIPARTGQPWIRVRALNARGAVLGGSRAVRTASRDGSQALGGVRRTVRRTPAFFATMTP
jgi:hypothetical protein